MFLITITFNMIDSNLPKCPLMLDWICLGQTLNKPKKIHIRGSQGLCTMMERLSMWIGKMWMDKKIESGWSIEIKNISPPLTS